MFVGAVFSLFCEKLKPQGDIAATGVTPTNKRAKIVIFMRTTT